MDLGWTAIGDPYDRRTNMPARSSDWWTDKIIEVQNQDWWSRGRLVLSMANQDGGAHVDPAVDVEYLALLEERLGLTVTFGGEAVPLPAREWAEANMRQIAHELVRTLQRDWRVEPLVRGITVYSPPMSTSADQG